MLSLVVKWGIALAVFALANVWIWATAESEPEIEIPEKIQRIHARAESELAAEKPELVLLGNSMLGEGIDDRQFAELTGKSVYKLQYGGSASAWWYLALKNLVAKSETPPRYVLLFFRDEFLTEPEFRVTGAYSLVIQSIATEQDQPVLERLAYNRDLSLEETVFEKFAPLYKHRNEMGSEFDHLIRQQIAGPLTSADAEEINAAINRVFADEKLDPIQFHQQQIAAEKTQGRDPYDFEKNVGRSFLPLIIQVAEQHGIQLVMVRVKRVTIAQGNPQSPELSSYIASLQSYLNDHQIPLWDFTGDERIRVEHFGSGDHLNRDTGRVLFTRLVAEKCNEFLKSN
jgi:hypothetical protein